MKLIEAYNETKTKEMLKKIKTGFTNEISFDDIYNALGAENFNYEQVTGDMFLSDYFPALNPQYNMSSSSSYMTYVNSVNSVYNNNLTYYHLLFSEKKSSERMIINVQKQENTIKLAQKMLSIIMDKGMENSHINSFKFMVGKKSPMPDKIKNDKIVIYYDKINRDNVSKIVFEAAKKANVEFEPYLSAFYHIASVLDSEKKEEQDKFLVGIGVEISGTSFTTERAKEIFKFMTGQSAPKNINAAEEAYLYDDLELVIGDPTKFPIRDEIKEMEPDKFIKDAYNLCLQYCKPF